MNGEQASSSHLPTIPLPHPHPPAPPLPHSSQSSVVTPSLRPSVSTSSSKGSRNPSRAHRGSHPFSFPPLFSQPTNSSSPSLVPAEGKPIPLDDSTTAHRTWALRELSSNYPSSVKRHQYAKSTGAQSSTYSQPVIVRTYSGPSPSKAQSTGYPYRPSSATRGGPRRVPLPSHGSRRPTPSTGSRNGLVVVSNNMPRVPAKKSKLPWQWPLGVGAGQREEEAKLPPLEAFSFKGFMERLDSQEGEGGGISANLDRIAEICARSRYSLSNQYEVHVAPHGSGVGFANVASPASMSGRRRSGSRQGSTVGGPTLQAIESDEEEHAGRTQRKRRSAAARRKSVAYGTLETIMSSSRSSEEDKTKKKPAAELVEEVRGRTVQNAASASVVAPSVHPESHSQGPEDQADNTAGRKNAPPQAGRISQKSSASFANTLLENKKHVTGQKDVTSPRGSAAALVSEPARPQASTSHLEIRTAPDVDVSRAKTPSYQTGQPESPHSDHVDVLADLVSQTEGERGAPDAVVATSWTTWIPWKAPSSHGGKPSHWRGSGTQSHAEGSLRQLLDTAVAKDKGKAVIRQG